MKNLESIIDYHSKFGEKFCQNKPFNPFINKELEITSYLRRIFDHNSPYRNRDYNWEISVAPSILILVFMAI